MSELEFAIVPVVLDNWFHVLLIVRRYGFLVELALYSEIVQGLINVAVVVSDGRSQEIVAIGQLS